MSAHPSREELDLYAAGMLEGAERTAVGDHVAGCEECRPGLASAEDLAWVLAVAAQRPAPAALRRRVVAPRGSRASWWSLPRMALAAAALLVVLGVALVETRGELERVAARRDESSDALAALAAGAQVVELRPPSGGATRGALVVSRDGRAFLVLDLPEPPAGRAYQAWVIAGGAPVRAGMAPARAGAVTVRLERTPAQGDVVAVTLEVAAGVDAPTSAPLLIATRPLLGESPLPPSRALVATRPPRR